MGDIPLLPMQKHVPQDAGIQGTAAGEASRDTEAEYEQLNRSIRDVNDEDVDEFIAGMSATSYPRSHCREGQLNLTANEASPSTNRHARIRLFVAFMLFGLLNNGLSAQ